MKSGSSIINKKQINENKAGKRKDSIAIIDKYLVGMVILLFAFVIGFVLLKNRSTLNHRTFQLTTLPSNKCYTFNKPEIKIGKAPDNDFVINHDGISRYHAIIRYDKKNDRFLIKDLGSSNGTQINTKKIRLAELKDGDVINFYKISFKVNFQI